MHVGTSCEKAKLQKVTELYKEALRGGHAPQPILMGSCKLSYHSEVMILAEGNQRLSLSYVVTALVASAPFINYENCLIMLTQH